MYFERNINKYTNSTSLNINYDNVGKKITLITLFLAHVTIIMTLNVEVNHINYTISSSNSIKYDTVVGKNHINYTISSSHNINYDTVRGK
jgi:hypothetical protein